MRRLFFVLAFISVSCNEKIPENFSQIWTYKGSKYTINFNFENQIFRVDTLFEIEGPIYSFHPLDDSGSFRFNFSAPEYRFECCEKDSIYYEIENINDKGISDRKGIIKGTNLYWREIKNKELEIVYNNCPKRKLDFYNRVMNKCKEGVRQGQ